MPASESLKQRRTCGQHRNLREALASGARPCAKVATVLAKACAALSRASLPRPAASLFCVACLLRAGTVAGQPPRIGQTPRENAARPSAPTLDIDGSVQADAIVDFKRNDPSWYDVNRPSKLPSDPLAFGRDHHFYLSPRQSHFGVTGDLPTGSSHVKATIEFDMFGVGDQEGQTTFQLLHAWGQWKQIGGG